VICFILNINNKLTYLKDEMISNLKSKNLPRVAVLMAAYNGVEWIEEQVDTLLSQKNININIFISVDLSDDNTLDLCSRLEEGNNLIKVLPYGEYFGGPAKNFYILILKILIIYLFLIKMIYGYQINYLEQLTF
jgi:glycosyltransferase involved in cell wall biosynthesis